MIRLISFLALLNPKTRKVLQYLSKCSSWWISQFFCICRNYGELFPELSSSASIPTEWVRRLSRFSGIRVNIFLLPFQVEKKIIFTRDLLCVAEVLKASMQIYTKPRGLGSQKKMGSCIKVDYIEIKIKNIFPIPCCCSGVVEIFIFHTDWFKVKNSLVVRDFLVVCIKKPNKSSLQEVFYGVDTRLWLKYAELVQCKISNVSSGFQV